MGKRDSQEHREFEELMEALNEEATGGFILLQRSKDGETIHLRDFDGDYGSISAVEFEQIKEQIKKRCFACGGLLELTFDPKSVPIVSPICSRCNKVHILIEGDLYLLVN